MKKMLSPFLLLTLPLMMAACGQPVTPTPVSKPVAAQTIRVHIGPSAKMASQGLPTGEGFSAAQTHLKVKVTASDGSLVTFKNGLYAPANDGDTFLTLNAQNGFSQDVLLPAGTYAFETMAKDGTDEASTKGTLLAYSKTDLTALDAGHSSVQLTVHTVMNTEATALQFALPTRNLYTNDSVGLRLNVKTNSVMNGEAATAYNVPTSDFSVGAYTAVNGTVNAVTASKLGVTFTAIGSLADRTTSVSVPVTGWIQTGPETASLGTVTVSFQHAVASGTVSADVTPPTAMFGELPGSLEAGQTVSLSGSAQDDSNISAARLYDGTTLVASSDAAEFNEGVQPLTFSEDGMTWNAAFNSVVLGDHALTLVVDDAAGNETTAEQTLTVVPMVFHDVEAPVINPNSISYYPASSESGQAEISFSASDNVCATRGLVVMNGQVIGQGSSSCFFGPSINAQINPGVVLNPGDVVSLFAYDDADNESQPVEYTIPETTPVELP